MRLDVRWPIGGMFSLIGLLLTVYGMVSDPALYERSLGINVNLWWGLALLVFGVVMLALAYRAQRAAKPSTTDSTSTP
jgi:protein-S-isoprenylcysteine O-methyltransferase Ste14